MPNTYATPEQRAEAAARVSYDDMVSEFREMKVAYQEMTAVLTEIRDAVGPTIEGLKSSPIAGMMGLK